MLDIFLKSDRAFVKTGGGDAETPGRQPPIGLTLQKRLSGQSGGID
ncbi:hypothetical protein ABENE_11040 [Asticcacaulis benevestitus DSM 16100 = ATCC BAA-896]|uniref:Uncharacterized protein n=1 Tax=Asticcacaulis benevestitus DSM 16100 = ATCC BAA-896 TaxID=1121022 RepID=V4RI14_9CAUL|nr:hypothetical protein ABENE_11040 [Asticcacaulis benevestitus DSM 16100 = ATCC BAA-896]